MVTKHTFSDLTINSCKSTNTLIYDVIVVVEVHELKDIMSPIDM